jgi:hypothetical protein
MLDNCPIKDRYETSKLYYMQAQVEQVCEIPNKNILVVPKPNFRQFGHYRHKVSFNPKEVPIYPLVLKRTVQSYAHVSCIFVVKKQHEKYAHLKQTLQHWYSEVPKGKRVTFDMTGDTDFHDFNKTSWYVIDLRKEKDTWENEITLKNLDKLANVPSAAHAISSICFNLYEACKSIVIFADSHKHIPCTLFTLAAWGLTEEKNSDATDFIYSGCAKGITTVGSFALTNTDENEGYLVGYHKFEEMPVFCSL